MMNFFFGINRAFFLYTKYQTKKWRVRNILTRHKKEENRIKV